MPASRINTNLSRAVIASEDDMFASHDGVQWQAIEKAWQRNEKAQTRASTNGKTPKVVGGSTITQQLAKNLFLSGERNFLRKGQELLITLATLAIVWFGVLRSFAAAMMKTGFVLAVTVVTVNPIERSFWLMAVASFTGWSRRPEPGYAALPMTRA